MKKIINKIKHFFLYNYKVKLLCLALAIVLWVFTSSNQSLLGKFPNPISIKVSNLSDQYQASLDSESVQIYAMADPSVWKTLTTDSFVASVDVAGLNEGTYELDVKVVSNVPDVQVTKIDPARVFVTIEKIITKTVAVSPKVDGDPTDGMIISSIDLTPSTVQVRGASSTINLISEANAQIQLNGESESFERDVKVIALGENSKQLTGVAFSPDQVHAKVTLIKGGNNKSVGIKVSTNGAPKDGYFISKITTDPSVVNIAGQRSILNTVEYIQTEAVDISGQSADINRDVNLIIPSGVALQSGSSSRVHLTITFSPLKNSEIISPSVIPLNLAAGLKLADFSPRDLTVTLSASNEILQSITSSNVKLNLDLTGKTAGIYNIAVSPAMITIPDGVTVEKLSTNTLSITISE